MIKKIFITSNFSADGILMQWASSEGIEVVGESLIDFNAVHFEMPKDFDVVIFYSKNAVRYFYEGLSSDQVDQVKTLYWFVLARQQQRWLKRSSKLR